MACEKQHRYDPQYNNLPVDQGGAGRHRCAGCAYERGYVWGIERSGFFNGREKWAKGFENQRV